MSQLRRVIRRGAAGVSRIADFQQAVAAFNEGDFRGSLVHLVRTRDILENARQQDSVDYYQTVGRLAHVYFQTENFGLAETTLQEGLSLLLKHHSDDLLLHAHYGTMAKFYLATNLEKAVKLLAALLSPSQLQKVPFNFQTEFRFLLGVPLSDGLRAEEGVRTRPGGPQRSHQLDGQQRAPGGRLQQPVDGRLVRPPDGPQTGLPAGRLRADQGVVRELLAALHEGPQQPRK